MPEYPAWICQPCGLRYGRPRSTYATWHPDTCGWCGAETNVTEPRDYGYPPAMKEVGDASD